MPTPPARPPAVDVADLIARRQLWPIAEAAYQLGMSTKTLKRRAQADRIRITREGARLYVTDAELTRYLRDLEAATA
jgi:hypothetical protein